MQDNLINSEDLLNLLIKKGVKYFYHANTMITSLTFIKQGALLSRGYVETNKLAQTAQTSDALDKEFDVWDTVFLDGTDLHKKFGSRNKYGPILFLLDLDILKNENFKYIKVTETNPSYWRTAITKYSNSIDDINKKYLTGNKLQDGRTMFLFTKPEKEISLEKYCKQIIIDDPKLSLQYPDGKEKDISDMLTNTITSALAESNIATIEVKLRHKEEKTHCVCTRTYQAMYKTNKTQFDNLFKK